MAGVAISSSRSSSWTLTDKFIFSIELLPLYHRTFPRGGEERSVIRIGCYNKLTFIFSPGSSSVSKVRVVHPPSHRH